MQQHVVGKVDAVRHGGHVAGTKQGGSNLDEHTQAHDEGTSASKHATA